ncbi:MAG: hypothetical protein VX392_03075 [Verrucomicrobiota bacterium]|nr:hypothetical protein [Verrucomicrobiota bacterium]
MAIGIAAPVGQGQQVELSISVPNAPFHVISDPVPLHWKFVNHGDHRLAFMWEGCCRLNGRVTASLGQTTLQSESVTSAAQLTAHRFARAARLLPGQPTVFKTNLGDWLSIDRSGDYLLTARYTGLLDNQQPNVTPGWQLWRQSANSKPVEATLLTPPDYVAKRIKLSQKSGLTLGLIKSKKWKPIDGTEFDLTFKNQSSQPMSLAWPSAFRIWILDANGRRVPLTPTQIKSAPEELTIKPGGLLKKNVLIGGGALDSKPFGAYRIFVDYKSIDHRSPSNMVNIDWRLGQAQLIELLHAASGGAKTGLRNKPLKLLRLHIASLGLALDQLNFTKLDAKERKLLEELQLAAKLKPFGPKPGKVTLKLSIEKDGNLQFANQALAKALQNKGSSIEKINSIATIQRHLGWAIAVELQPNSGVTEQQAAQAVESLKIIQPQLAKPPALTKKR